MKTTIAATRIIANPYSHSPELPSPMALAPTKVSGSETMQSQTRAGGNHLRQ